jgi:hypothetical protein
VEQGGVEGARTRRGRGSPGLFIGGDLLASGLREGDAPWYGGFGRRAW